MQQVRALVGFKNTNTRYHYDQMTYAMYFYTEYVYIYEDGENRGYTGFGYSYNASYDVRIELKEEEGARYYYRPSGFSYWILVYDSDYSSAASFKRGADVHSGTFYMDDLKEIAAGKTPTYYFYSPGRHAINLTVYDRAMQACTDSSIVIIQPVVPNAGDDQIVYDSVTLVGNGIEITSIITKRSAENLKLKEGKKGSAVIKATNVMIGVEEN